MLWRRWLHFWRDRVGNAEFEAAIRAALRAQGGRYAYAQVCRFRLAAIARPGWVQVYRFMTASEGDDAAPPLWGLLRDDGRRGTQVLLFASADECQRQFALWSEGLILSPSERR